MQNSEARLVQQFVEAGVVLLVGAFLAHKLGKEKRRAPFYYVIVFNMLQGLSAAHNGIKKWYAERAIKRKEDS